MARFLTFLFLVLLFIANAGYAQRSIKTKDAVEIGGIHQWIGVNGKDNTKPLLLFLHGGPGFSSRSYSRKFIKGLNKEFIVVQWDQRETGITAHWSPYKGSLDVEVFHKDTYEVVQYLLKRFSREKIYLVGFSWGGFLGLEFAKQYPELLHAYISVSSMIHGDESERLTLNWIKEKAATSQNEEAIEETSKIKVPFRSWEDIYYQRKWTAYYSDEKASKKTPPPSLFETWALKWLPVYQEASQVNFFETASQINCPVYFFVSNRDYVSNYKLAEKYYHSLKAKEKQLIWFEQSTHEIPTQEPKKFAEELIKIGRRAGTMAQ